VAEETKERCAFVYGDFRRLHRMGLIACLRGAEIRGERVLADQATEAISAFDAVWFRRGDESECWSLWVGRREVECSMRPVPVVGR
jgi:hypothetical protein